VSCLIGTTQELSLGTAAQAHLGASAAKLDFPSDPTGPQLYAEDVVSHLVKYDRGYLVVPEGPGLGVTVDAGRLAKLASPLQTDADSLPSLQDRTVAAPQPAGGARS
jgi:muconate cycloisomerase